MRAQAPDHTSPPGQKLQQDEIEEVTLGGLQAHRGCQADKGRSTRGYDRAKH
jgi:hypothetical protein